MILFLFFSFFFILTLSSRVNRIFHVFEITLLILDLCTLHCLIIYIFFCCVSWRTLLSLCVLSAFSPSSLYLLFIHFSLSRYSFSVIYSQLMPQSPHSPSITNCPPSLTRYYSLMRGWQAAAAVVAGSHGALPLWMQLSGRSRHSPSWFCYFPSSTIGISRQPATPAPPDGYMPPLPFCMRTVPSVLRVGLLLGKIDAWSRQGTVVP